ncbi:Hypothetical protein PHPALM_11711 [Phytophthora palmivora]|uniref:Uncharacterized protein n=1 Tax=Phytophthora palmivora TaxID=4796 RepID=A0A2P4Y1V0_9STRA|nr:Hypothetical protein PHPALM_11711 [Phytophthora palmivora]
MKIFLEEGFTLVPTAGDYKDQVLDAGRRAEDAVLGFLRSQNINVKGAGSVYALCVPSTRAASWMSASQPTRDSSSSDTSLTLHPRTLKTFLTW